MRPRGELDEGHARVTYTRAPSDRFATRTSSTSASTSNGLPSRGFGTLSRNSRARNGEGPARHEHHSLRLRRSDRAGSLRREPERPSRASSDRRGSRRTARPRECSASAWRAFVRATTSPSVERSRSSEKQTIGSSSTTRIRPRAAAVEAARGPPITCATAVAPIVRTAAGSSTRKIVPFAHLALERQRAPERSDDAVADGQAEPSTDAHRLGREERLEDAAAHLRRDSHAVVAHFDDDPIGRGRPEGQVDLVGLGVVFGESLHGVEQKVQKDLPEPRLVRDDVGDRSVVLDETRAVANLVGHHRERRVEELRELQAGRATRSRGARTFAGCGRCFGCAPRHRARAPGRGAPPSLANASPPALAARRERRDERAVGPGRERQREQLRQLFGDVAEVQENVGERVVDLVRHARRRAYRAT